MPMRTMLREREGGTLMEERVSREVRRASSVQGNSANRAFGALVAVAALPVVLVAVAGCGIFGFVVFRLSAEGLSALAANEDLRPAVASLAIFVVGLAVGARTLLAQVAATRRLVRAVESAAVETPPRLRALAERCRVGRRLVLVPADDAFSFAYGLGAPAVAISTGLVDAFSDEEIVAVLEHERYHVRARDPLKVVTARTLTATFFYLPVLRPLLERYRASREIAADRAAVATAGRRALAGALYRSVAGPTWADVGGAAALGGTDLLEDRVRHLETGDEPAPSPLPVLTIAATFTVIALLVAALLYTVIEAGGPTGLMRGRMDGGVNDMGSPSLPQVLVSVVPWFLAAGWLWQKVRRRRA